MSDAPKETTGAEPIEADPRYAEGFHDAPREPLFSDADPVYAAGWHAYWRCWGLLGEAGR